MTGDALFATDTGAVGVALASPRGHAGGTPPRPANGNAGPGWALVVSVRDPRGFWILIAVMGRRPTRPPSRIIGAMLTGANTVDESRRRARHVARPGAAPTSIAVDIDTVTVDLAGAAPRARTNPRPRRSDLPHRRTTPARDRPVPKSEDLDPSAAAP